MGNVRRATAIRGGSIDAIDGGADVSRSERLGAVASRDAAGGNRSRSVRGAPPATPGVGGASAGGVAYVGSGADSGASKAADSAADAAETAANADGGSHGGGCGRLMPGGSGSGGAERATGAGGGV